jgi:hypothetical protein
MPDAAAPGRSASRYRLYVDESGNHTFTLLEDPARRYLALLGVWFQQGPVFCRRVFACVKKIRVHRPEGRVEKATEKYGCK